MEKPERVVNMMLERAAWDLWQRRATQGRAKMSREKIFLFLLFYYMKSDLQLKQETIQYQHAGVYTTVLQSGHQFCIGNDCWGSAAVVVKHLGSAHLPLSPLLPRAEGRRVPLFHCNGGKKALAGASCLPPTRALQDSSATRYAVNPPPYLTTLHAIPASSSTSPPSLCSEASSFCFFPSSSSPQPSHSSQQKSVHFIHFSSIAPTCPLVPPSLFSSSHTLNWKHTGYLNSITLQRCF